MISYCTIVYQEHDEVIRLLNQLKTVITENDEIVVVQSYREKEEQESEWYLSLKQSVLEFTNIIYGDFHFHKNFSEMKNHMNSLATKDYIFNLDADEYMLDQAYSIINSILLENPTVDLYYLPRINTVEDITQEDIDSWGWNLNEFGWINWPDYQARIYKNNKSIQWTGVVHEHLSGQKNYATISSDPKLAIIHNKHILKQRVQNLFYNHISKPSI
jgi:hypothetical protein